MTLLVLVVGVLAGSFIALWMWISTWRSRLPIIVSSWGIVLAGQADGGDEVLRQVEGALVASRIAPFRWRQHADRFLSFVQRSTQTYAAVHWGELEALTGAHPIGTDLYVSWNLVLPARGKQFRSEELGLNETNELRAFASAALGITQEAVTGFAVAAGRQISSSELEASGLLGPLRPAPPSENQAGGNPRRGREHGPLYPD